MSSIKFTDHVKPLTIGQFGGECFLFNGFLHIVTTGLSKEVNGIVCFNMRRLEIVDFAADIEIKSVDVEIITY